MVVALEEGHLPGQMWLITNMAKRAISRNAEGQSKLVLVRTHQSILHMSFQNWLPRSILFQITKIWQHPPLPATKIITSGAPLAIILMVYGVFTGKISTRSGNKSKEIKCLLVFSVPLPMQYFIATNLFIPVLSPHKNNNRVGMIFRTLISYPWVVLSY